MSSNTAGYGSRHNTEKQQPREEEEQKGASRDADAATLTRAASIVKTDDEDDDGGCLLDFSAAAASSLFSLWGPDGTPGLLDRNLLSRCPLDDVILSSSSSSSAAAAAAAIARHVTKLDLRRCNLKRLPEALDPVGRSLLANLKTLLLRGNNLKSVPAGWLGGERGGGVGEEETSEGGCAWRSSLEHVDLRLNKLDALPETVGELTNLLTLMVSNNRLTSLPPTLARCVNLRRLWMSNNRLTELPAGIGRLPRLESLFVNANALVSFPPCLPPRLVSLDVSGNRLENLSFLRGRGSSDGGAVKKGGHDNDEEVAVKAEVNPPPFSPTIHPNNHRAILRDVYAVGNRVSRLEPELFCAPDALGRASGLQRLYLGSNNLNDAGLGAATWTALGRLRDLQALDLSGNPRLREVHSGLDALWGGGGEDGDVGGGGGGGGGINDACSDANRTLRNLRLLDLRGTGVTDSAFAAACPCLMRAWSGIAEVEVFLTGGVGGSSAGCYGAFGGAARRGDGDGSGGGGGGGGDRYTMGKQSGGGGNGNTTNTDTDTDTDTDAGLGGLGDVSRPSGGGSGGGGGGGLAAGEEPPLERQLAPLTTVELQTRLRDDHGVIVDPARSRRPETMLLLCSRIRASPGGGRAVREVHGEPVPESLTRPLLDALRSLEWPTDRERGNVTAEHYITLSRGEFDRRLEVDNICTTLDTGDDSCGKREKKNKEKKLSKQDIKLAKLMHKQARYRHLWEMASAVMAWAAPSHSPSFSSSWLWDGLAVSHNFVGSPHVDTHDVSEQFAMSLGDFDSDSGGELCVESGSMEVTRVNTHGRLAKVDGRYAHWVRGYGDDGERFSLIWYRTMGEQTPKIQAYHPRW